MKPLRIVLAIVAVLVATGAFLYARNATPVVPTIAAADAAADAAPWVVKMHAQWCPVCMMTKGVWTQIERMYAGRVRLAVFDFTSDATTAASRAEAERLGLTGVFDEAAFATGSILVVDGRGEHIAAWIAGSRDFAEYRSAIDAALAASGR
jgi:thiol-disulfide isomerase/thioredoxin